MELIKEYEQNSKNSSSIFQKIWEFLKTMHYNIDEQEIREYIDEKIRFKYESDTDDENLYVSK